MDQRKTSGRPAWYEDGSHTTLGPRPHRSFGELHRGKRPLKTTYHGVWKEARSWGWVYRVYLRHKITRYCLGIYFTAEAGARVWDAEARIRRGSLTPTNFPPDAWKLLLAKAQRTPHGYRGKERKANDGNKSIPTGVQEII